MAFIIGVLSLRRWLAVQGEREDEFPWPEKPGIPRAADDGRVAKQERRSDPDPQALAAAEAGSDRIGFDLEQLKGAAGEFEPLVEHLTYIQVKRGEQQSLIFVRKRDLDTLAALTGKSKEDFVEEFQQLGVMLSMN